MPLSSPAALAFHPSLQSHITFSDHPHIYMAPREFAKQFHIHPYARNLPCDVAENGVLMFYS